MKGLLFLTPLTIFSSLYAQKVKKKDHHILANIKEHVNYLASDKLEGRRAGTEGENLAANYISDKFQRSRIKPKGNGDTYFQFFDIPDGKKLSNNSLFTINKKDLLLNDDYFPLNLNGKTTSIIDTFSPSLYEKGHIWYHDIAELINVNRQNPHFDLDSKIRQLSKESQLKGATALLITNTSLTPDNLKFDIKKLNDTSLLPIFYIKREAVQRHFSDPSETFELVITSHITETYRRARNVIGYIDNNATKTVVIGAHFDHLGYGEDGNSMFSTKEKMIHNGADDNASGTASLLELARILSLQKKAPFNYLFIAFSGEEQGLFGSKYFVQNPTIPLVDVTYMINMDMVGRMNDSSRMVTIGGYGTSPVWSELFTRVQTKNFKIKIDSSGTGPSDHTSFYRKDIPVLFFFTGLHSDYHKPSDDANRINYTGTLYIVNYITSLIEKSSLYSIIPFLKTREQQTGTSTRFTVSLGIMPDYTFTGPGVRVDGVSEGKLAKSIGILAGDVLINLGANRIDSVESYMQSLSKFKKGDKTTLTVLRGDKEITYNIVFQ